MTWAFSFCNIKLFWNLEKTQLWSLCHLLPNLAARVFLFDFKRVVMRPNLKPSRYEKSRGSFVQKARGRRCSQILHRQQSVFFYLKWTLKDFLNNLVFFGSTYKFDRKITITLKIFRIWHFLGWLQFFYDTCRFNHWNFKSLYDTFWVK